MNKFQVSYITHNQYSQSVRKAVLEFLVLPEESSIQRYSHLKIMNSMGIIPQHSMNLYQGKLLRFNVFQPFTDFSMEVSFVVERKITNPFDFVEPSVEQENRQLRDLSWIITNHEFLQLSYLTTPEASDIPGNMMRNCEESVFCFLQRLNNYVYKFLNYKPKVTDTQTRIDELFRIRKGVCQDFAHLFLCIARINGIPARYVSGYLDQGEGFMGTAALHAWVEALIPGVGWIGFDPTNNLLINGHYIKIAHGIDYRDCMPVKGVLHFSGESETSYYVKVKKQEDSFFIQNQVQSQ